MPSTSSEDSLTAVLALLIMHCERFVGQQRADGSLLCCGEQIWRYQHGKLQPASRDEYEHALSSPARSDWPPYTIRFEPVSAPTADDLIMAVDVTYDCGITEDSRGGSCSTWQLQQTAAGWQVLSIDYDMFDD